MASTSPAAPAPARCSFFDESNLGGERQDTPACSNGGYIFVGLIDPTRVDQLLAKLLPLLTSAVGNLIASGAAPGSLVDKAPYQTKELYAEFMEYLTGGPSYNGKLDKYDNVLAKALPRDQTADVETSNHRSYVSALDRYPQACNINLLHVQLTPAAEQDDSDTELRRLLPASMIYAAGLSVYTGLDRRVQAVAERAVREAAEAMPDELRARIEGVEALSAPDRDAIVGIARLALAALPPTPASRTPRCSARPMAARRGASPRRSRSFGTPCRKDGSASRAPALSSTFTTTAPHGAAWRCAIR